jgi:hypothetical protein
VEPAERAAFVTALAARVVVASAGLISTPPPAASAAEPAPSWITPEDAATIASVPVRRIYKWADGQRWASRPSRKCLRIDEAGFRRWLATR